MLSDDVILDVFDFYVDEDMGEEFKPQRIEGWITLAHVCRRWRSVVFQSPLRLNLRLLCTPKTRVTDTLDIWPPLPLVIRDVDDTSDNEPSQVDNIIAALECNDRVCQINLGDYGRFTSSELKHVTNSAAMHKPFPELIHLWLAMDNYESMPILPDSFLGGTAPRLRSLYLRRVPFPAFQKVLLSATHLVKLDLSYSAHIPPEAMATSLSTLTSLESLRLHFLYEPSRPALESRRSPPLTRSILPNLTKIQFHGVSEYLEVILARIDAPRLDELFIMFFNHIILDTPQLFQFVSRNPTLRAPKKGIIDLYSRAIGIRFRTSGYDGYDVLTVKIPCTVSEGQLSPLKQVCTSSLPPVSTLEDLHIFQYGGYTPRRQDDTQWLDLLHPFAAVKNLYLFERILPHIAPALQELVGGRTTEVLPTLENIFFEGFQPSGPLHECIEKFVAARRLTSHPVAASRRDHPW